MAQLLEAISADAPCGEYLKDNRTLFRGLRNYFNQAQSSYRQLMESPDAMHDEELLTQNAANWNELSNQCEKTIETVSKDVEVMCWLSAAQPFSHQPLENLASVLASFTQLVNTYWDDLHPKPPEKKLKSEDDTGKAREWAEFRVKPFLQLVGERDGTGLLSMPLQSISLIGAIDYSRYYSAERDGQLEALKSEASQYISSNKEQVKEMILALGEIKQQLLALEASIVEKCRDVGAQPVSFRFINQTVDRLINASHYLVGSLIVPWPLDVQEPASVEQTSTAESAPTASETPTQAPSVGEVSMPNTVTNEVVSLQGKVGEEIYTRDQAFQQLRHISDYFSRTEPHSPVYMLLERAIRWGYMSLPDLLNEMVGEDDKMMGRMYQLAGLESVDKTVIPDPTISASELSHKQQSAPVKYNAPPVSVPKTEKVETVATNEPVKQEETVQDNSASSGNLSSFEW